MAWALAALLPPSPMAAPCPMSGDPSFVPMGFPCVWRVKINVVKIEILLLFSFFLSFLRQPVKRSSWLCIMRCLNWAVLVSLKTLTVGNQNGDPQQPVEQLMRLSFSSSLSPTYFIYQTERRRKKIISGISLQTSFGGWQFHWNLHHTVPVLWGSHALYHASGSALWPEGLWTSRAVLCPTVSTRFHCPLCGWAQPKLCPCPRYKKGCRRPQVTLSPQFAAQLKAGFLLSTKDVTRRIGIARMDHLSCRSSCWMWRKRENFKLAFSSWNPSGWRASYVELLLPATVFTISHLITSYVLSCGIAVDVSKAIPDATDAYSISSLHKVKKQHCTEQNIHTILLMPKSWAAVSSMEGLLGWTEAPAMPSLTTYV